MTRKLLALLMTLVLIFSLSAYVFADESEEATVFVFTDEGITVSGNTANSYKIDGTALTIQGSGTYSVSGTCANGSIKIKKGTVGVTLILNGLTLSSSDTAPIACNKSTAVTILAAAGTVNTLTDSAYNNDDNYPDNENAENAVIKCKDGSQVTLGGSGTLNIVANGKNGVKGGATTETEGEARLTVQDLTLNITANVNDGLKSDQELNILSGNLTVKAADDGIKSDLVLNIGANGTAGPTICVTDSYEGIEAATLNVYSGNITVHASDDGMNAANSDLTGYSFALNIYGGTLYIDAQGDGLDSNGTLTLADGTVEIYSSSRNDNSPLDADGTFTLSGGTVLAVGSGGMAQNPNSASVSYVSFGAGGMGGGMMPGPRSDDDADTLSLATQTRSDDTLAGPGGDFGGGPGGDFGGGPGGNGGTSTVSIAAGDKLAILDASGNTCYSATAVRAASYVFFSSADLTSGESYTLSVNGTAVATATASADGAAGGQPGGDPGIQPPGGDPGIQPPGGDPGTQPPTDSTGFTDVQQRAYYYDAVLWAVANNVTTGTAPTTFSPNDTCTRAQVVTFLWRAAGCPTPSLTANPFTDVQQEAYYYSAVLWAVEQGITNGTGEATFSPQASCTRAQIVTFLWRAAGEPKPTGSENPFADVTADAYYYDAVLWAVENEITNGTGAAAFSPNTLCTRAQVVTFLYRDLAE